jgi:hypothetical protein
MTPKRYFHSTYTSPYFQSEHYKETQGYKSEAKVNRILNNLITIPRRFFAGIKKTLWPL